MRRLQGAPASAGVVVGEWIRIRPPQDLRGGRIRPDQVPQERERLAAAMEAAAAQLDALAEQVAAAGHGDEAGIFAAQATMARDPALRAEAEARIAAGDDAVAAILAAGAGFARALRQLDDPLLQARAADVDDVVGRIAGLLTGSTAVPSLPGPAIVVADELPPSVTASLPRDALLGLALEGGSPTAHAAILARAYGIPAVVGIAGLLEAISAAEEERGGRGILALDGETGEVVVEPDATVAAEFAERRRRAGMAAARDRAEAGRPAVTTDGVEVVLLANIGTPAEAARCLELGAQGVGLFRTEFLFVERPQPPDEEEQVAAYREVVEAFAPHPVVIRLLDVGGDKPIPYLPLEPEANPFLGVRALRLAQRQPELFITQLRAAMRVAATAPGRVKVMAPMVADAGDVAVLLELADRAQQGLAAEGVAYGAVSLGVMLEIPSAVLVADSYAHRLAFASLGTNDLLQYTLAVDRGNRALARYQDPLHPALLRLVRMAVEAAEAAGIELSVCGEMAGDPPAALALVGLGIRRLSMAAGSLPAVRRAIRAATAQGLAELAREALRLSSAAEVRARFAALVES
jgi:phosphoenolpyruvate-protein phosphotransferase